MSPVAILGNNDVSWRLVVCSSNLKVNNLLLLRECACAWILSSALLSPSPHVIQKNQFMLYGVHVLTNILGGGDEE